MAGKEVTLPHRFTPRDYQVPVLAALDSGFKRAICVWHRRSGKDKTILNYMIKESCQSPGIYYYFFPTYAQAKKVIWTGMDRGGFRFLDHFPPEMVAAMNKTDMSVELVNGSQWQLVGTDNYNSIMGTNPIGCVFSEYSLQDPNAYSYIRPILRENGGWAVFIYTPRGENHGYDLYQMALSNPNWYVDCLTIDDTGVLGPEDIEEERAEGMDEDLIQQEYYCSFTASMPGAYFGKEMSAALAEGRITPEYPYVPGVAVDTWWDLGMDDSTSIVFSQNIAGNVRVIDYYENSGEGLAHYVDVLAKRTEQWQCNWGRHVWPHDGSQRELGTGKSRMEIAYEMGLRVEVSKRPQRKEDSIEAARRLIPYTVFRLNTSEEDTNGVQRLLRCLRSYRKDWDEVNRVWRLRPVHDWASHGADAFQTLANNHWFADSDRTFEGRNETESARRLRERRQKRILTPEGPGPEGVDDDDLDMEDLLV